MSAMTIVEQPVEEPTETPVERPASDVSAAEIAAEIGNDSELKRKSKVAAFTDLPGVPQGTTGKVALVDGWGPWIRYHVLWDNGVDLGSINRPHLVPAKEYDTFCRLRDQALASGVFDEPEVDETEAETEAGGGGGGGDGATVNGVTIPAHLIERSKAARQRLGG